MGDSRFLTHFDGGNGMPRKIHILPDRRAKRMVRKRDSHTIIFVFFYKPVLKYLHLQTNIEKKFKENGSSFSRIVISQYTCLSITEEESGRGGGGGHALLSRNVPGWTLFVFKAVYTTHIGYDTMRVHDVIMH